jgi:signal transduction histidine kinase
MMYPQNSPQGIVFLCDDTGKIVEVVQNDIPGADFIKHNVLFPSIVERESMGKALSFLLDIRRNRITPDWEINLDLEGKATMLYFFGAQRDKGLLVVGAPNYTSALQLFETITKETSGDKESIKDRKEARSDLQEPKARNDELYFDELTRLYNELSNVERELAKQNVELKRLSDLKNQFLGTAAHDLRNPIWMIGLYSQFLLEDASTVLNEEQVEFLNIIKSHSENMQKLVDNYLDFATIESGKLKLDFQPTDLNALIRNNVYMNRPIAGKKQIELWDIQDNKLPEIEIDADKIDQVLNNLISNAIRFSLPQTKITVRLSSSEGEALIAVKDEGVGIPEKKSEALFEPFEREGGLKEDGEKSAGLGLYIAKKIVHEHRGRIWVESEVGEGSIFYIALPLGEAENSNGAK